MTTTSAFLLKHLDVKQRSGFEWLCLCPYHQDRTPSFSINIRKKLFICYACGAKGNMNQLMEFFGVKGKPQEEELSLGELTDKISSVSQLMSATHRPEVGVPVSARFTADSQAIEDYWEAKRGLSKGAVTRYGLGYDTLSDQAIIPIKNHSSGQCVGLIRRTCQLIINNETPRYMYSKGMKISENVFGAFEANKVNKKQYTLVITEGAVDAMSVYQLTSKCSPDLLNNPRLYIGVAVLGSRISKQQALIIKSLGFENIIIATDMDRAGRVAQTQVATMLKDIATPALISKASWDSSKGKDLNELGEEYRVDVLDTAFQNVYFNKQLTQNLYPHPFNKSNYIPSVHEA